MACERGACRCLCIFCLDGALADRSYGALIPYHQTNLDFKWLATSIIFSQVERETCSIQVDYELGIITPLQ